MMAGRHVPINGISVGRPVLLAHVLRAMGGLLPRARARNRPSDLLVLVLSIVSIRLQRADKTTPPSRFGESRRRFVRYAQSKILGSLERLCGRLKGSGKTFD